MLPYSDVGICKTLNFTKCSRVFYIIIANDCIKSCVARPKSFWHYYLEIWWQTPCFSNVPYWLTSWLTGLDWTGLDWLTLDWTGLVCTALHCTELTDWRFGKWCRAILFETEEKTRGKRKDQDKKNKHTNLAPAVQQANQNLQYAPVLRFQAPWYLVRFFCKCVWNNMQTYM